MSTTLSYTSGYQDGYYRLNIELGTSFSAKLSRHIVIDTGSTGIVVPEDAINGYEDIDEKYPNPSYSSSGNAYEGKWVKTSVKLYDDHGNQVITTPLVVFAAKNAPHVSMMGVGFNADHYSADLFNPFINVLHQSQDTRQGYIIQKSGVVLGLTSDNSDGFSMIRLQPSSAEMPSNFDLPLADIKLTYDKAAESPFKKPQLPLLVDTGISYMIITNGQTSPLGYESTDVSPHRFYEGVNVSISIPTEADPITYEFDTQQGDDFNDNHSPAPSYVRWGHSSSGTILNTGRHFTYIWDYLFDPDNKQMGFKK